MSEEGIRGTVLQGRRLAEGGQATRVRIVVSRLKRLHTLRRHIDRSSAKEEPSNGACTPIELTIGVVH